MLNKKEELLVKVLTENIDSRTLSYEEQEMLTEYETIFEMDLGRLTKFQQNYLNDLPEALKAALMKIKNTIECRHCNSLYNHYFSYMPFNIPERDENLCDKCISKLRKIEDEYISISNTLDELENISQLNTSRIGNLLNKDLKMIYQSFKSLSTDLQEEDKISAKIYVHELPDNILVNEIANDHIGYTSIKFLYNHLKKLSDLYNLPISFTDNLINIELRLKDYEKRTYKLQGRDIENKMEFDIITHSIFNKDRN